MTDKEAMKLALDALEIGWSPTYPNEVDAREKGMQAIAALKERLADPMREVQRLGQEIEQEPPKYSFKAHWEKDGRIGVVGAVVRPDGGIHLLQDFIDPPQRTKQEPTAKYSDIVSDGGLDPRNKFDVQPQRTWVGLTGEEMFSCNLDEEGRMIDREVAKRNVEALLKEKNT
jgi:hypothetical protein